MGEFLNWSSPFLVFFFENDESRNKKSSESNSLIRVSIVIGQKGGVSNEVSPFFIVNQ